MQYLVQLCVVLLCAVQFLTWKGKGLLSLTISLMSRVKKEDSQMNLICGGQGENQWEYIREDLR